MSIDLRQANVRSLAYAVFNHEITEDAEPWYYHVKFEVDPERQLRLLAELLHGAPSIFSDYSSAQIEAGLWCMMGGTHSESFTDLIWDAELPLTTRLEVIAGVYPLYDRVLAAPPHEPIDFRYPDDNERRFRTIDYMVPDLLIRRSSPSEGWADKKRVKETFLDVFGRLLAHNAPVAQYAALHGLGHLEHHGRKNVIDRYLADHPSLDDGQREYAQNARRGHVL
jgi:hypothetical protein